MGSEKRRPTAVSRVARVTLAQLVVSLPCACVAPVDLGGATSGDTGGPPHDTTLPPVATQITNVVPAVDGDSVGIDFDPVDDAVDYRIYPLPADGDVTANMDGTVTVRNAIYRCAGHRQTFDLQNNRNASDGSLLRTRGSSSWNAVIPDNPTLGYVYVTAGSGRSPVYALAGVSSSDEAGWQESRTKIYTRDAAERDRLLSQGYRDDGIAFYVPATASANTKTIYRSRSLINGGPDAYQHYFDSSALAARMNDDDAPAPAFEIGATEPKDGTAKPLMVLGYDNGGHDELAVGKERFARAAYQGAGPLFHLEWSGLKEKTTLVVEALDAGCPYQAFLSASHVEAPPHQTFATLADVQASSAGGEVFVNGQFDTTARPKAIARSFVTVTPSARGDWDWFEGFDGGGAVDPTADLPTAPSCYRCIRKQSSRFDSIFSSIDLQNDTDVLSYGEVLGQLWLGYDDNGGGTLGKAQFTALQKASIPADPRQYLHVTFSTGIASTLRRFPQLILSDRDPPTDQALEDPDNHTLVFQARGGPEVALQVVAIHGLPGGTPWALDNTNPGVTTHYLTNRTDAGLPHQLSPQKSPFEHAGIDRMTKFDVYVSSSRLYAMMDGEPAGCTLLPDQAGFSGPASVTFGDVFFDEAAEPEVCTASRPYDFQHRHGCHETARHFDELGFRSNVSLPEWDEQRFPCSPY